MNDLVQQRQIRLKRDAILDTPNCPKCLHRMEPVEVDGAPVWLCSECGTSGGSA